MILDRIFFSIYDRRVLIVSQYVMDLDDTIPGRKGSSREQVLKVGRDILLNVSSFLGNDVGYARGNVLIHGGFRDDVALIIFHVLI